MLRTVSRIWRALTGKDAPPRPDAAGGQTWAAVTALPAAERVPAPVAVVTRPAARPAIEDLSGQRGRDLPGDMRVPGGLRVTDRPRLRSIGDGLIVGGDLKLGGDDPGRHLSPERKRLAIRALPRGLRVGGSLELRNCFLLERLPDDLFVGGSIVIEGCDSLAALPGPLHVAGSLTIVGGRSLVRLPADLRVGGDFRLSGTRVTALRENLSVGGSLVVEGRSRVASIPTGMTVGGDVALRRLPIEALPAGLRLAGTLRVQGARRLKRLPDGLAVPGTLDLCDCSALEELPAGLHVGRSLKLRGCVALRSLPPGLTVPDTLDLRGCGALARLSAGLRVGVNLPRLGRPRPEAVPTRVPYHLVPALRLADCPNLTELPDDLELGGPIEVAGSGLRDLPPSLSKAHVLWRGVLVPPDVVFHPERIAPLDVLRQPNAELRRVMMERVGPDAVLTGVGAETRDLDADAGGERRLVFIGILHHCYLVCRCPSTGRQYLLRVPPDTRTCRRAAAWVAGFDDPEQYRPVVET